jgi:hypothetical protein
MKEGRAETAYRLGETLYSSPDKRLILRICKELKKLYQKGE